MTVQPKLSSAGTSALSAGTVWFDGELVPQEQATISVLSHALHYGTSVFEGIRAYETAQGAAVFRLNEHSRRLLDSAKIIGMKVPLSGEQINHAILSEYEEPPLEPESIAVEVHASLVSPGSEIGGWRGLAEKRTSPDKGSEPRPFGYSNAGVVLGAVFTRGE